MVNLKRNLTTPRSRQKEYYSDFSMNLDRSPITGSLLKLRNEDAVKQSIKNLILTNLGERFYRPNIGSNIQAGLFEMVDEINADTIQQSIFLTLRNHEPRAENVEVRVLAHPEDHYY